MYEIITHIMESYGMTFDEVFTWFFVTLVGCLSGFGFFLSLFVDLGRYLYRGMKELFRFIIRRIRNREKVEP